VGRSRRGCVSYFLLSSLYWFERDEGGMRMPHHDGDLRRNRSGEDKGLFVYIAMIYIVRSHALNEEIKKNKDESACRGGEAATT